MNILEKMKKEQDRWICLTLKINLLAFQIRFKKKKGFYRSLSSGGNKLLGISNFIWFNNSFDQGFYRSSITIMGNIEYHFFFRISEFSKFNIITRQLLIRCKKLGAFNVKIDDLNSINDIDTKLLSSQHGMSAYQKILKTYSMSNGDFSPN